MMCDRFELRTLTELPTLQAFVEEHADVAGRQDPELVHQRPRQLLLFGGGLEELRQHRVVHEEHRDLDERVQMPSNGIDDRGPDDDHQRATEPRRERRKPAADPDRCLQADDVEDDDVDRHHASDEEPVGEPLTELRVQEPDEPKEQ